ncbi:MAG: cytochrome c biogenesis CcdA family protein [Spirochaetota bacterium]
MTPTLALSFAAGILSFLSPCIVPLVPSYLSFVGGVAAAEASEARLSRGVVVLRTALFVLGFSLVFVLLGLVFSGSGALFSNTGTVVNMIAGAIVVALGLNIIFDFWKFLNLERRVHFSERPAGHVGAIVIGMAFGAGWTPCIGPILASILLLAGTSGSVATGALYLTAFSLGLGVPFLIVGVFLDRASGALRRIRRYLPTIKTASGVLLIVIGLLIAFGRLQQLSARLIAWGARLRAWDAANPGASNRVFGIGAALLFSIPLAVSVLRRLRGRRARDRAVNATPDEPRGATQARLERRPAGFVIAVILSATGVALAVLNVTDIVSIADWFFGWFQFTGL